MNPTVSRRYRLALHPLALAAMLHAAAPAVAQDADVAEAVELNSMTVTATRRAVSVQDVPMNLTAVDRQLIDDMGLNGLASLLQQTPGLNLINQGGRDANLIIVRGLNGNSLGASEGVGNSAGGVVAQYIGDVPLYLDLRLIDLERVEALLGPQGTLYGAGALGGAIRYIPARPSLTARGVEVEGGVMGISHGDDLGYESTLIGNLPLGERLAFRAAVSYADEPGYIDYGYVVREPGVSDPEPDFADAEAVAANLRTVADANDNQTLSGRLMLRYLPVSGVDALLSYHYQNQQAGARTINQQESMGTGRYESANRFEEPNERENQLLALEVSADLGFATLNSATGLSQYSEDGQRDQTDLLLGFEFGYESFPSFVAYTHELGDEDRFNQELRLVSNGDGPLSWIAGVFYNALDSRYTSTEFTPGIPEYFGVERPDNIEYYELSEQTLEETAIFAEFEYALTESWSATLGGRAFQYDVDARSGFALPLNDGSAPDELLVDGNSATVSDGDAIFKFNTAYAFDDGLLAYFTLSQGYRNGGVNTVPACLDPLPPGQNVCALPDEVLILPDKTLNHELGLRSRWLQGRLVVNGSLYFMTWDDPQIDGTTENGGASIVVNGGAAETQGINLQALMQFSAHWSANASWSLTQAQLTEDSAGIVAGEDAYAGDRLPGSPEYQGTLNLQYERPLGEGMLFSTQYGIYRQTDIYTRVGLNNEGEVLPGYTVHNASMTVRGDAWALRLYANNLLDTYAETGVRGTPASIDDVGYETGDVDNGDGFKLRSYYKSVLEPLRVGLTLSYRFGDAL